MKSTYFLATANKHKLKEISEIVAFTSLSTIPPAKTLVVEETGSSYWENALLKAKAYYRECKQPVISDDSGLEVEALPEELGIKTARFGRESLNWNEKIKLLLKKLQDVENRSACFICVLCFYLSPQEIFFFEGRLRGSIAQKPFGEGGFGFDPIFLPSNAPKVNHTLAMDFEWKLKNSHRRKAFDKASIFFKNRS